MYRRPKFLEILLEVREQMSREAEFDIDLFVENLLSAEGKKNDAPKNINAKSDKGFEINTETIIKKD